MYEFIRGILFSKDPVSAVIEAGGVGYRVNITASTFDRIGAKGAEVTLLLHHSINAEQGMERLFGFCEDHERLIFRQLLEVQRVGPSVAMRILSNAGAEALVAAIAGGDVSTLKRVKGVGAKMAERLVVELQEPLSKLGLMKATGAALLKGPLPPEAQRDAIAALANLGYKPAAAEKAVSAAVRELGGDASTSDLIRAALQQSHG